MADIVCGGYHAYLSVGAYLVGKDGTYPQNLQYR